MSSRNDKPQVPEEAPVITIDGPSGVGKGSIAQRLADHLGWHILDSGALYRLTGIRARKKGVNPDDEPAVAELAAVLPVEFKAGAIGEPVTVWLDGEDVTREVRSEDSGTLASRVAVHPAVRLALLDRQRNFRKLPGLVADGRDMGTVIFPGATCKIYLTASAEVRARRRFEQLKRHGRDVKIADLLREIEERDARDQSRSTAPSRPASDAVLVDTSNLDIDAVFLRVLEICQHAARGPAD